MADHGGGNDGGPVFVDIYGTAGRLGRHPGGSSPHGPGGRGPHGFEGPHPDGPFWLRGLKGELPLWIAFWGGFFFGHGIIIAFSVGAILFGTIFGLSIDPERLDTSVTTAYVVGGIVLAVFAIFVLWAAITVWRSAKHAELKRWGIAARLVLVTYLAIWAYTLYRLVT